MEINRGLSIYEKIELTSPVFSAAVTVEIDPVQYWRDRPLYLSKTSSVFEEAIAYQNNPMDYLNDPTITEYLEKLNSIDGAVDIFKIEADRIREDILRKSQEASDLIPEDPPAAQEREINLNGDTIEIKDSDMNIISTISFNGEISQENLDSSVKLITLDEDIIFEGLDDAIDSINESIEELSEVTEDLAEVINEFSEVAPIIENPSASADINASLSEPVEHWYGIPLINLSSREVPTKESYILHIDTKNNWTLNLTNISSEGVSNSVLRIDKTIPPHKKFTAGISQENTELVLYLQIEDDPKLYTTSINTMTTAELRLVSYGDDNSGYKTICGYLWDAKYRTNPVVLPSTTNTTIPLNPVGPRGEFYDSNHSRVIGSRVYPVGNWKKPAYNSAEFYNLGNYIRMSYNSYMDRFFCRYNLQDTSFSIVWHHYQIGYPTGIRTLLADNVYNNYIRYDYENFELLIDFNNKHYKERITLPEFLWCQFSIRFNMETNELVIQFRDFAWDRIEEIKIDIGTGLEFELISLWGRFDKEDARYLETQKGIFGMLAIDATYFDNDKLDSIYKNHKQFLDRYDPYELKTNEL